MTQDEFLERMMPIWDKLNNLKEQEQGLVRQMEELQHAGMVNATIHIRSDTGGVELLHPTGSEHERTTGRRREYIGKKQDVIEQAKARVDRYHTYQSLCGELSKTREKIKEIQYHMGRLEMAALGTQARLFSSMGTTPAEAQPGNVPKNWKWLTPQMVIDYFRQSPVLAGLADDVQEVLSKVAWIEQKAA